jgi:16S rRNA (adenine1518-N6/adenine1519-N6)-dimethyltransferase
MRNPRQTAYRIPHVYRLLQVKVVANLPYNITKDLLLLLLPLGDVISDLHIMIQHEVAERLTQRDAGTPDWRAMNIRTLFFCRPK